MLKTHEYVTLCNFGVRISQAKKPGLRRVKREATLKQVEPSQLILISNFVSLQVGLKLLLDKYRLKYGDSFPPGSECALHSTRFKSRKFSLFQF